MSRGENDNDTKDDDVEDDAGDANNADSESAMLSQAVILLCKTH